jgi:glutaryl-CoA dehydrogenase
LIKILLPLFIMLKTLSNIGFGKRLDLATCLKQNIRYMGTRSFGSKIEGIPILDIEDPFKVSSRWTEEQQSVQNTVKRFSQDYLGKRIEHDFRNNNEKGARNIIKEMGRHGLLGVVSQGLGNVTYGIIAREIETIDSAYRSALSVQSSLVIYPINKYASNEVKDEYLSRLYSGDIVGCFGLTEPDHGSDPSGMTTYAVNSKGGYILNGSKMWITNSPVADVFVVWAKDRSCDNKISGFVLDRHKDEGIQTPKIENKLSLNASITGEIVLNDVWIPENRKLDVTGLRGPFSCLNQARFGIAWGVLGCAVDCLKVAYKYGDMRKQFGKRLTEFQLVQHKLANYTGKVGMALSACQQLAELRDTDRDTPEMVSILKAQNCQLALETAQACREILGGNGIVYGYSPIRHLMNLQAVCTYEGTTDVHNLIVGRGLTGRNAFF